MASEGKIKSKELSYEANLPPFLQRLHAQKAGHGDPDRHERQLARPKRANAETEDDGPTVIDESGETVSKEELDKMTTTDTAADEVPINELVKGDSIGDASPKASGAIQRTSEQKLSDGTATKKRKVGRVVGDDDREDHASPTNENDAASNKHKLAKKVKKKVKPIKLAFDNDDSDA